MNYSSDIKFTQKNHIIIFTSIKIDKKYEIKKKKLKEKK